MGKDTKKKFNNNPKTQRNTRSRPDSPVDEKSLEPPQKKTVTILNRPDSTETDNIDNTNVASGSQGNMEVDPAPLTENESTLTPVTPKLTTNMDEDQAHDPTENLVGKNSSSPNVLSFERIRDASSFYIYCAYETFLPGKPNKEKINHACEMFNGVNFLSFIGASVKQDLANKTLKIVRFGFSTSVDANNALRVKFPNMAELKLMPLERPTLFRFNPILAIKVTEIPISTSESVIRSTFAKFGNILRCSMITKNLWQQATISYDEGTDMTVFKDIKGQFILKDLVRVHPCSATTEEIQLRSKFALKLTNLPKDTSGQELETIAKAVNAMTWVVPKARSNYRNLQYAFVHFASEEDLFAAVNGDQIVLDNKRLIWTQPDTKLCAHCAAPGHDSRSCRKKRAAPQDRQTQNLYQRFKPAQFKNYSAPPKPIRPTFVRDDETVFDPKNPQSFANRTRQQIPPLNKPPTVPIHSKPPLIIKNNNNHNNKHNNNNVSSLDESIHANKSWSEQVEDNYLSPRQQRENHSAWEPSDATKIMLKLDALTETLAKIHTDLNFTIRRLDTVERHLNIFTLTPEKVVELNNANKGKNKADKADMETDESPYEEGADTSESKIVEYEGKIQWLAQENEELRLNNKQNIEKLNSALEAVARIQKVVYGKSGESLCTPIPQLNKPGAIWVNEDGTNSPHPDLFF